MKIEKLIQIQGADVLSYFDGGRDQKILGASDQSFCADKSEFCNNYGEERLTEMLQNLTLENFQDANKVPVRCVHYSEGTEVSPYSDKKC